MFSTARKGLCENMRLATLGPCKELYGTGRSASANGCATNPFSSEKGEGVTFSPQLCS